MSLETPTATPTTETLRPDQRAEASKKFRPAHVRPARRAMSLPEVALAARRNILETIPTIAYRRPILSGKTVGRWHMLMDPDGIRRVLLDAVDNYPKSRVTQRLLRPADGDSIFTAEGEAWRWQRRAAAPIFNHRKMVDVSPVMTLAGVRAAERLAASVGRGFKGVGVACVQKEMTAATFDVVCDALLAGGRAGAAEGLDRPRIGAAINRYLETIGRVSLLDILEAPDWVPRPAEALNRHVMDDTIAMVDRLIAYRREEVEAEGPKPDLISYLLLSEDPETGRRMDDATIRNNILSFIVAGHETTALTLAWALYLLGNDADAQDRAAAEAQAALGADRAAKPEHLPALPFTRQVVEEALRLFPPAALLSRQAVEADTLCGREIQKGDTVLIPIYALHRHEALWERPLDFYPDHFKPEGASARSRFAYLPFGGGPRICIGMSFALMEAQVILATLLSRLRFAGRPGHTPEPVVMITLRPKGGMPLRVSLR